MSSKQNIVVTLPLVWGVRNFILTGLHDIVEQKYNVYYCVPSVAAESLLRYGISRNNIIINKPVTKSYLQKRMDVVLKKIHNSLHPTKSFNIFQQHNTNSFSSRSLKLSVIKLLETTLVVLCSNKPLFKLLTMIQNYLFDRKINSEFITLLKTLDAKFIFSTSSVVESEWTVLRVMQNLGVPIYAHVLSFDNITSRGYIPIDYFNIYMVWNERMKQELLEFYAISPKKIYITGTPQFDYHVNSKYLLSENDTKLKLGVGNVPYIIYCANHYKLTPLEPELFTSIVKSFQQDEVLKYYDIVLRLHPMDQYERWNRVLGKFSNVRINYAWPHAEGVPVSWGEPALEEVTLFSNALRYAKVVLNIASTIAVDAAITDTPSVCIAYHPTNTDEGEKYLSYHYSDHYEYITNLGSSPLALNNSELVSLIKQSINTPAKLKENRRRLVTAYTDNSTLGESTEIIARTILS